MPAHHSRVIARPLTLPGSLSLFCAAMALSVAFAPMTKADESAKIKRPAITFTTNDAFSAKDIPAYKGQHKDVYAYIKTHKAEHLENLRRWVRQPSISAQNNGVTQMAELLRDDLKKIGFKEAEVVPTSGHPGVWGFYDAGAAKTLVVYMMYDVQPIEAEGWKVKAFDGELVDNDLGKVLMARGAINQKGPQRTFLNAVEAIIAVNKKLPVNLMVLAEGEEELGSPHYPELIDKFADRLKTASGVIFPASSQSPTGEITVTLGVKGVLYLELEAHGGKNGGPANAEIHSSWKAISDAPAWRLTQALATLTSADGNTITVPGYYDGIRQPNLEEQRLVNGMLKGWESNEPALLKGYGMERWIDGWRGRDSLAHYLFDTTLNIDGLTSGYGGPGTKTILPHKAVAKVDSRLVPGQTAERARDLIRKHLDDKGFTDIEIRTLSAYPAAQTSVEAPVVRAAIGAYNKIGVPVDVSPRTAGSAPYYVFTEKLKLPMVMTGVGHGSGAHAPNEYIVIDPKPGSKIAGLEQMENFYVDLLYAIAAGK
ncbi:M20/M25/M40 family metallo-hydrolase [Govanella unica]|uniref:M20/M25/M40 family metallo-hydrolase n=1 Tax=Govanella unica TaxID=2975056 RepID=A0A9X3TW88_9PROT|nr:M20/M25/M40 family metallo-hydrolase [Govania unica]MDA5192837.1 M20/M25/M40 family metallo-hydrolase [Govania unica]